jgi:hypothetical protein
MGGGGQGNDPAVMPWGRTLRRASISIRSVEHWKYGAIMIIAERKPFAEIKAMVAPYKKILIVGCGTCGVYWPGRKEWG